MAMTEQDRAELEKYLEGVDSNAKAWHLWRWIALAVPLPLLGICVWILNMLSQTLQAGMPKDFSKTPTIADLEWARDSAMHNCFLIGTAILMQVVTLTTIIS